MLIVMIVVGVAVPAVTTAATLASSTKLYIDSQFDAQTRTLTFTSHVVRFIDGFIYLYGKHKTGDEKFLCECAAHRIRYIRMK